MKCASVLTDKLSAEFTELYVVCVIRFHKKRFLQTFVINQKLIRLLLRTFYENHSSLALYY